MKILPTILVFIISVFLVACTSGAEVSGRSLKSANRSVTRIKNRLPEEQRIEFEVSYWTLRDSIKTKDEFLNTVGGKTAEELIVLGKEVFQQRKNEGFKKYEDYLNWNQMIAHFTQKRIDQNRRHKTTDEKRNPSVMYRL